MENAVIVGKNTGDVITVIMVNAAVVIDPGAAIPLYKPAEMVGGDHIQIQALLRMVVQAAHQHQLAQIDFLGLTAVQIIGIQICRFPVAADTVIGSSQAVDGVLGHDDVFAPDEAIHRFHITADRGKGLAAVIADKEAAVAGSHRNGQRTTVVLHAHFYRDSVRRQTGTIGEVPVDAAVP